MEITDLYDTFTRTSSEAILEVLDDSSTSIRSEHKFSIKAKIRSRFFFRKYYWSGGDDDRVPEMESQLDSWGHPNQRIHGPLIREGKWRILCVDLGRTFAIGEETEVYFRQSHRNLEQKFEPFLGLYLLKETKSVKLKVILPQSLARRVVVAEMLQDTQQVISSEPLTGCAHSVKRFEFSKEFKGPFVGNTLARIYWENSRPLHNQ